MVRPRASDRNLSMAVAFGKMIIIKVAPNDFMLNVNAPIPCHGPKSLHALFASCCPHLSREAQNKHPSNRCGVTMVEFNKALHSAGYRQVNYSLFCRISQII